MTEAGSGFKEWFESLAGANVRAYDWQIQLATCPKQPSSGMFRVPTGMGKTLGVVAGWSWHRLCRGDDRWPRRLVWCLPMRVLVEQTERVVRSCLDRIGRLWDGSGSHTGKVGVHLLMGGVNPGGEWSLYPEECAVLIGTQDMLLSRALNRGYAAGRARWPSEFGLLNHDVLWVFDEVQLMDVGLATSAQLQAFCDEDASKGFRPRLSWWMSATLQHDWLNTVDTQPHHGRWASNGIDVQAGSLPPEMAAIRKQLRTKAGAGSDGALLAKVCMTTHRELSDGDHGRITLVVCNTVERACQTFKKLLEALQSNSQALDGAEVRLVHSRFRAADRARWVDDFLGREACRPGANRIIVATQVIEAGVDLSAGALVTELAPWPSLVQRFGRCARFGGNGTVVVVDPGTDEAAPYEQTEVEAAREALTRLCGAGESPDVGVASLDRFERTLDEGLLSRLYRYEPRHLLLRREFDELFDTTPDLSGADIDISHFIREGDERDVQVFWMDVPPDKTGQPPAVPDAQRRPGRSELCAVPFLLARDWLCGRGEKKSATPPRGLRKEMRAWSWDWIEGAWTRVVREALLPGRIVCVAADSGGYTTDRGFDEGSVERVPPVQAVSLPAEVEAAGQADERAHTDETSQAAWKTIATHASEVAQLAAAIAADLALSARYRDVLTAAAWWHDLGKAHPAFQGAIRGSERPADRCDLAKAPKPAWLKPPGTYRTLDDRDQRPGLRHELASLLGLFALLRLRRPNHPALLGQLAAVCAALGWDPPPSDPPSDTEPASPVENQILNCSPDDFDLLAYLVVSHHGKVRTSLHAGPKDQEYHDPGDGAGLPIRGVREGDRLPPTVLDPNAPPVPELILNLSPAALGLSPATGRSWNERTLHLLARWGPGALAWLEAVLVAADRRASALAAPDRLLVGRTAP